MRSRYAQGGTTATTTARGARGSVYTITASITVGHTMLRWLLLPTAVRASNAWHTDENCGCHNLNSAWGIRTMFERGYNASLAHRANDLKTLKDKSKQTKSEKKLRQALTYELWRSLRAYRTQQISTREEAEQEVVTCVAIKVRAPHAVDATCASVAVT